MRRLWVLSGVLFVGCSKPAAPSPPIDAGPKLGTYYVGEAGADLSAPGAVALTHLRFGTALQVELPLAGDLARVHFDGGEGSVPASALRESRPEPESLLAAAREALARGDLARAGAQAVLANVLAPDLREPFDLAAAVEAWEPLPGGTKSSGMYRQGLKDYDKPKREPGPGVEPKRGRSYYLGEANATLAAKAGDDAPPLGTLPTGAQVTVLQVRDDGLRVRVQLNTPGELLPLEGRDAGPGSDGIAADGGAAEADAGAPADAGLNDAGPNDAGPNDAGPVDAGGGAAGLADAGARLEPVEGYLGLVTLLAEPPTADALWAEAEAAEKAGRPGRAWPRAELAYALAPDPARLPALARLAVAARAYDAAARAVAASRGLTNLEREVGLSLYLGCRGDVRTAESVGDLDVSQAAKLPKNACLTYIEYPACAPCDSQRARTRRDREVAQKREKREKQFPDGPWLEVDLQPSYRPERARESYWVYALPLPGEATCDGPRYHPNVVQLLLSERPMPGPVGALTTAYLRAPSFDDLLVGLVQAPDRAAAFAAVREAAANPRGSYPNPEDFGPRPNTSSSYDLCDLCDCGD